MSTVQVQLPSKDWEELVGLGRQEQVPPGHLLEQAVRRFLEEKKRRSQARKAIRESFGLWKNRADLETDSAVMVRNLRREWDEREQRLGLA
jgi:hypothetical protein